MNRVSVQFCSAALIVAGFSVQAVVADDKAKSEGGKPKIEDRMYVKMSTSKGDMYIELDAHKAPISVKNFLEYVDSGFYDGTIFHRIIATFMIQGGGFDKDMKQKPTRPPIQNEWKNGLKNLRGTISMARTNDPNSATSQFFINVVDNPFLDQPQDGAAYAVFGRVIKGMEVADAIKAVKTGANDVPNEQVMIQKITRVSPDDPLIKDAAAASLKQAAEESRRAAAELEKSRAQAMKIVKDQGGDPAKGKSTPSGLWYVDVKEGTGPTPQMSNTVAVHCTGWITDGTKFYTSRESVGGGAAEPIKNAMTGFVRGFTEGLSTMKVGGKRILIIPGDLGYGPGGNPRAKIPPNATLVFEVELTGIPG